MDDILNKWPLVDTEIEITEDKYVNTLQYTDDQILTYKNEDQFKMHININIEIIISGYERKMQFSNMMKNVLDGKI